MVLVVLLVLLVTGVVTDDRDAEAQDLPRPSLNIRTDAFEATEFDDPPETELVTQESRVQTTHLALEAQYPLIFDQGRTLVFLNGAYRQRRFDYQRWPDGFSRDLDRLHEFDLGGVVRTMLGDTWAVVVSAAGQIQSNLEDTALRKGDFKMQGAVVFERPFGPHWSWGFGAAYASTFGRSIPFPLLSFRYDAGGRWHASGHLPAQASVYYRLGPHNDLGLRMHAEGSHYHIAKIYPEEADIGNPQLQYMLAKIGPEIKQRLGGWGELNAMAGFSYQMLGIFDGNDELEELRYDLKPAFFASCGVGYNF